MVGVMLALFGFVFFFVGGGLAVIAAYAVYNGFAIPYPTAVLTIFPIISVLGILMVRKGLDGPP